MRPVHEGRIADDCAPGMGRKTWFVAAALVAACVAPPRATGAADPLVVRTVDELRAALADLKPGTLILIRPGAYAGRFDLAGVAGTETAPVMICGDPGDPPVFAGGGSEAWHLSACSHVVLRDLIVRGQSGNGINVDDGGRRETPSRGIRIERVIIEDVGPEGNHDALKMSGVDGFLVKDCSFSGWGGSAVDLVGCHDGEIVGCSFAGKDGFSQHSGVQIKGGSARVSVLRSRFVDAGARAVNAGGHTGLDYFRPPGADAEARDLVVDGCIFLGGEAPIAAVGVAGLRLTGNSIHLPEKWILRVLQENRAEALAACGGVVFARNRVVFDGRVRTFVNVGPGILPGAYELRDNDWVELGPGGGPLPEPRRPAEEAGNPFPLESSDS